MSDTSANTVALIAAAGSGERLGLGPKAFLQFEGTSLLMHVVRMFENRVDRIIVGLAVEEVERGKSEAGDRAEIVAGGSSRFATFAALLACSSEPLVVLHDVARPFIDPDQITRVLEAARAHGAATTYVRSHTTAARIEDGFARAPIARTEVGLLQAPHAFQRQILERLYRHIEQQHLEDPQPMEQALKLGIELRAVLQEDADIKITTPQDWAMLQTAAPLRAETHPKDTSQRDHDNR